MKEIEISPALSKLLSKLDRGSDEVLMNAIGGYYTRSKKQAIGRGTVPGPALSRITAENRPGSGGHPLADTGALMRSIAYEADSASVVIGSPLRYARIVSDGGTITARRARMLAIPAGRRWAAATRAAGTVRALLRKYGPDVRFTGKAILIRVRDNSRRVSALESNSPPDEWEVAFYRRRSVTIPARPFLKETTENIERIRGIYIEWALTDGR